MMQKGHCEDSRVKEQQLLSESLVLESFLTFPRGGVYLHMYFLLWTPDLPGVPQYLGLQDLLVFTKQLKALFFCLVFFFPPVKEKDPWAKLCLYSSSA